MSLRTRDLVHLRNTGQPAIHALFSKAHSMDWDIDRDVDWQNEVSKEDPLIAPQWAPFGRTPTFQSLPREIQTSVTRQALGRMLNILQVGESVAQDVCAKLALLCEEEDYRNHAVAQAMDEARHHLAYVRFLDRMGDEVEDIDPITEAMFDRLLESEDPTFLIAGEQFFLESLAMPLFESLVKHARDPLLKQIVTLITRDESRHIAFGILYVERYLANASTEDRLAFARLWLPQIIGALEDRPGGQLALRVAGRLRKAGADDPEGLAQRMREEQPEIDKRDRQEVVTGRRIPQLLSSARRAGLLVPDILRPLDLLDHPLVGGALRRPGPSAQA
jgi:hypothetical protein